MATYRYEVWQLLPDNGEKSPIHPFRIVEHFAVCDGGMRGRLTDKCFKTLAEARYEKKRLEETQ